MDVYEYRWTRHRIAELPEPEISRPAIARDAFAPLFAGAESERLVALHLNARHRPIGSEIVASGSVASTQVRIAEVFRGAVRRNAAGVMIAHNHPSGSLTPSPNDLQLTADLAAAGRILDCPLLDHLILTDDAYVSLRDLGHIR